METRDSVFDRLTWGRVNEAANPKLTVMLGPMKQDLEYMITQYKGQANSAFGNIYVDIVDDLSFNALAFKWRKDEYVGINAGVGVALLPFFQSLLSSPLVFPEVGDVSLEIVQEIDLPSTLQSATRATTSDLSGFVFHFPRCKIRSAHATYLCSRAWAFLVLHELAHISRCHLEYLEEDGLLVQSANGLHALHELGDSGGKKVNVVRRTLECDADRIAAGIQVAGMQHNSLKEHTNFALGQSSTAEVSWDDVAFQWLMAVGMLFQLFAVLDKTEINESARTHPHPVTRLPLLAGYAAQKWKKVIPEAARYQRVGEKALDELGAIWAVLNLPTSHARTLPSWISDFKKDRATLTADLGIVNNRLNELTMRRVRGL